MVENFVLSGNWVDLILIGVFAYFLITNRGFINTLVEAIGFIFALGISYKLYSFFGQILASNFDLPKGLSNAAGFFIAWFLFEAIFFILIAKFILPHIDKWQDHKLNKIFGVLAGALQAFVLFLFFVSLVFALPVRGQIKKAIIKSRTGPTFVNLSQRFEENIKNVFGEAVSESLNFLTIKPTSGERVDLGFRAPEEELKYDPVAETLMLNLLNEERSRRSLQPLVADEELRPVARAYAMEMFTNGFFSHVSAVDGSTPADRANRAGVDYQVIGENLALAPDVYLAHQGLMNSQGHRENILSQEYGRVGIGVVDGGIYGRIFVQNFRD